MGLVTEGDEEVATDQTCMFAEEQRDSARSRAE